MTYLKKEQRNLLHDVNDIIESRSETLSEKESETHNAFQNFLHTIDEESEMHKAKSVEKTRIYRMDPKVKKKIKKQNHQQYLRRKEKLMQEKPQTGQEEQ